MTQFSNITLTKKANVYFDGKVTSRTVEFADGSIKTLGVMQSGDYEFGTDKKEIMEILAGDCEVQFSGANTWQTFNEGDSFEVDANSQFKIKAKTLVDYCCSYV